MQKRLNRSRCRLGCRLGCPGSICYTAVHIGATWRIWLNGACMAATRSLCQITFSRSVPFCVSLTFSAPVHSSDPMYSFAAKRRWKSGKTHPRPYPPPEVLSSLSKYGRSHIKSNWNMQMPTNSAISKKAGTQEVCQYRRFVFANFQFYDLHATTVPMTSDAQHSTSMLNFTFTGAMRRPYGAKKPKIHR